MDNKPCFLPHDIMRDLAINKIKEGINELIDSKSAFEDLNSQMMQNGAMISMAMRLSLITYAENIDFQDENLKVWEEAIKKEKQNANY